MKNSRNLLNVKLKFKLPPKYLDSYWKCKEITDRGKSLIINISYIDTSCWGTPKIKFYHNKSLYVYLEDDINEINSTLLKSIQLMANDSIIS